MQLSVSYFNFYSFDFRKKIETHKKWFFFAKKEKSEQCFGSLLAFNLKLAQAHIDLEFYSESTILAEPVKKTTK